MRQINPLRQPHDQSAGSLTPLPAKLVFFGTICLTLLLAACTEAKVDRSFLTDDPCAAPCWQGLTLDQSTKADLVATLTTLDFVDARRIREDEADWKDHKKVIVVSFDCLYPAKVACGDAGFVEDRLKYLWTSIQYELTLGEVVTKLGEPDYVEFAPYEAEAGGCVADFFWLASGISVQFFDTRSETICEAIRAGQALTPGLRISSVLYTAPGVFEAEPNACCTRADWAGLADPSE
jgi:hypothetical protein